MKQAYKPESAGSIMSTAIPVCNMADTCADALRELAKDIQWDDIHHVYLINNAKDPQGYARIADIVQQPGTTPLSTILKKFPTTLHVDADQEEAVFASVKNDLDAIPVTNGQGNLVGAVTARSIIDVMHNEHVEDILFTAGIRRDKDGSSLVRLAQARLIPVFKSRAPWLVGGAIVGITLGLVSRQFEAALEKTLSLAFFVPVVAYIADSVGTQAEAITVRALAVIKVKPLTYVGRELAIGFMLGVVLGTMGAVGSFLISQNAPVALVVGLSLVTASTLATGMAAVIPIIFKALGKDPALGSGPIATALQDILSIVIYFGFALLILGA